jgi:epoxyqueuosine reductase QueG
MNDPRQKMHDFLHARGISIIGFGTVPDTVAIPELNTSLPRAIVFGFVLSRSVLDTIKDRPTLIYKHHYKTVNWILDQTACHVAAYIERHKARALAIPASQTIDREHRKGHISHIFLGARAGLGYIGRNGLLIHPEYGAQVRYVSVLTDLDFIPDTPVDFSCGECRACIEACPVHAISERGVDIEKCYRQLCAFAGMRGIGQHICGVCVKVCHGTN